jgi:MHS family citrate/tricarballylate:H+ symporter-like MFS transporter
VDGLMALPVRARPQARHVAAVTAGNALEFYDFLTYAFFAAQIGRTFFPSADPASSLLASLATFGAGFLMRPVGALVIGRIGDRAGRKPAMLISFALMGAAMIGLALTPSYRAIGVAAPALAILFRLIQGFALGGEIGPNTAYLVESAPSHRRGLYVSYQYMSQDFSILVSGLVGFGLSSNLSEASLDAWGWRAAFLVGAAIVPFGLLMRRQLVESLPPPEPEASAAKASISLPRIALIALAMLAGGTTVSYVLNYLTTYATATLHMATKVGFLATIATGLVGVILDPLGGWLSDRFGRKPVMMAPWALLLIVTIPGFWWASQARTAPALVGLTVLLTVLASIGAASVLVSVTESVPARIRSGALGLIYAFAISIFGGSTQFNVAWLTSLTHSPLAPAWYMTGGVAVGLIAMLFLPETAPGRQASRGMILAPVMAVTP